MIRRMEVLAAVAACLLCCAAPAVEEGNEETPDIQMLREALQRKPVTFPEVRVNTSLADVRFTSLGLDDTLTEVEGKRYFAFRFTAPKDAGELVWSFRVPAGAFGWYIVPAAGRMYGFTDFAYRTLPQDVPGLGKQGDRFIVQRLPAFSLDPGAEYIMWFGFNEGHQAQVLFSLNVFSGKRHLSFRDVFPMLYPAAGTPTNSPPAT